MNAGQGVAHALGLAFPALLVRPFLPALLVRHAAFFGDGHDLPYDLADLVAVERLLDDGVGARVDHLHLDVRTPRARAHEHDGAEEPLVGFRPTDEFLSVETRK